METDKLEQTPVNDSGTSGESDTRLTQWRSPTVRTLEALGYTYFIRAGSSIKIGHASNFKKRLHALQTANERPLEVLAVVPASMADEYKVHQLFAGLRMRGEWFRADRELLDFIDQLKADAKDIADAEIVLPTLTPYQASLSLEARTMIRRLINLRTAHGDETAVGYHCSNLAEQIENMATYKRPEWATDERQTLPWLMARQMKGLEAALAAVLQ